MINSVSVDAQKGGIRIVPKPPGSESLASRIPESNLAHRFPEKTVSSETVERQNEASGIREGDFGETIKVTETTHSSAIQKKMENIMSRSSLQPATSSETLSLYGQVHERMFNSLIDFARPGFLLGLIGGMKTIF